MGKALSGKLSCTGTGFVFFSVTLQGSWGTADDFAKKTFHVFLSAALFELAKSIPVHCLKMSSHLFLCLLLLSFTVPCRIVPFAKPEGLQTWPNPLCFSFLTKARSLSYSPSAAWISASIRIRAMDYVEDVKKISSQRSVFFSLNLL